MIRRTDTKRRSVGTVAPNSFARGATPREARSAGVGMDLLRRSTRATESPERPEPTRDAYGFVVRRRRNLPPPRGHPLERDMCASARPFETFLTVPPLSQVKPEHVREYARTHRCTSTRGGARTDGTRSCPARGRQRRHPEKSARASPSASASADVWGRHTPHRGGHPRGSRARTSRPDAPRRELELRRSCTAACPWPFAARCGALRRRADRRTRTYRALVLASGEALPEDAVADDGRTRADDAATEEDVPEADERVAAAISVPIPIPVPIPFPRLLRRALDEPRTPRRLARDPPRTTHRFDSRPRPRAFRPLARGRVAFSRREQLGSPRTPRASPSRRRRSRRASSRACACSAQPERRVLPGDELHRRACCC